MTTARLRESHPNSPPASIVAGVLDSDGGLRVVITQHWRLPFHVNKGERSFLVPGLFVYEPVSWERLPWVIEKATRTVLEATRSENACGGCNMCCFLPYIPELNKASHSMCHWCLPGLGCITRSKRPTNCKTFECLWLSSQGSAEPMAQNLRPDRCGVMLTQDTTNGENDLFEVHVHRMTSDAQSYIDAEQSKGRRAKFITYYRGEQK